MLLTSAQMKPKSFESRRNSSSFFLPGVDAPHYDVRAWALGCFHSLIGTRTFRRALTASLDSCAEVTWECPFSGVSKSGRVWRKVPEPVMSHDCGYASNAVSSGEPVKFVLVSSKNWHWLVQHFDQMKDWGAGTEKQNNWNKWINLTTKKTAKQNISVSLVVVFKHFAKSAVAGYTGCSQILLGGNLFCGNDWLTTGWNCDTEITEFQTRRLRLPLFTLSQEPVPRQPCSHIVLAELLWLCFTIYVSSYFLGTVIQCGVHEHPGPNGLDWSGTSNRISSCLSPPHPPNSVGPSLNQATAAHLTNPSYLFT